MRPRTIALVGAAIVAAGLILQQLIAVGVQAAVGARGAQLDQSLTDRRSHTKRTSVQQPHLATAAWRVGGCT